MANETVATFEQGGKTYEIDHLGAADWDSQWGEFDVYCDDEQVAYFAIPESALKPEFRPESLPPADELIELAKRAVGGDVTDPLPPELSGAIDALVTKEG